MTDVPETVSVALHWLRPLWLWVLLPLLLGGLFWWSHKGRTSAAWNRVVDPNLQPYVLEGEGVVSRRVGLTLLVTWVLTVLLLAGPVVEQQRLPVVEARRAEVIIVDLSRSMAADDLAPSRVARARFKLGDILDRIDDDRVALVAFAERPYVISPLTDDIQTLKAFIPSLEPALMPAQGSRLDLAINKGRELLEGANVQRGHLLLITDGQPGAAARDAAEKAAADGHVLSVLAVGTRSGAPLRDEAGGFVNDDRGQIVIPQLDYESLGNLVDAGGGVLTDVTAGDEDIILLERARRQAAVQGNQQENGAAGVGLSNNRQWIERGPWLVPLIALLYLLLFRRGTAV